jgi:hypothetical protein
VSPAFEAFLVRLYVDSVARERFLRDPRGEATVADTPLTADEVEALVRIDRTGLELAAASYAAKRQRAKRPGLLRRWISRLF